jgi:hypothetical protein
MIYNNSTYKYDISCNNEVKTLIFDFSKSDFYKLLSLEKKKYIINTNSFTSGIVNFNSPQYININFSNITNDVMIGNNNYNSFNFIIPCSGKTNFSEIIEYNNINYNVKMKVNDITLNYLDIVITDDNNKIFENNNMDYFLLLQFE